MKKNEVFKMPKPVKIMGRSSSITNSFVNGIIPCVYPTHAEIKDALDVLDMKETDVRCAYCGAPATEWDHFHPLIVDKKATGYISEIHNLVPACGKCNESKGNSDWETWMRGKAKLSPASRGIPDLEQRIQRLKDYENKFKPMQYDFAAIVGQATWDKYMDMLEDVIDVMRNAQKFSDVIKSNISKTLQLKRVRAPKPVAKKKASVRTKVQFSVNGTPCQCCNHVIVEAMKIYIAKNPSLTPAQIVKNWDPVKIVPYQVETDIDHRAQRAKRLPTDSRYDKRSKEIKLPKGGSVFVSTQFTGARTQKLAQKINAQPWGVIIK